MSPKKLRAVVSVVKKLTPRKALDILPFVGKRAAGPLSKVIENAIANARQKGLNEADLVFKEIQIGEGPRLKRGREVSRGRWHPYKRRMSHIRVVLETKTAPSEKVKKIVMKKIATNKKE
ncbi:50S ribosomal protein L22 [Candidatus Woesebacteria bacterium]|nr:50S ribosomal protein L22 [Candidatus Woesebacteria bacterium]